MHIHFPLLSVLATGFLLFFALQGGDVELHSIEVGINVTSESITVTCDPAFVVWTDRLYPNTWLGETFGNVAVVWRPLRNSLQGEWIKRFETNHIIQYRALGWGSYLAGFFLPIDPMYYIPQRWDDPNEADRVEWLPPDEWINQWSFISVSVRFQQRYSLLSH